MFEQLASLKSSTSATQFPPTGAPHVQGVQVRASRSFF
jgi:hypothetical protein